MSAPQKPEEKKDDADNKPRRISTKRRTRPVFIDDVEYIVIQMTGKQKEDYQTSQLDRYEQGDDPDTLRIKDGRGMMWDLISRVAFRPNPTGQPIPLKREEVEDVWSSEALEALFEECEVVNGISRKGVERAKND